MERKVIETIAFTLAFIGNSNIKKKKNTSSFIHFYGLKEGGG